MGLWQFKPHGPLQHVVRSPLPEIKTKESLSAHILLLYLVIGSGGLEASLVHEGLDIIEGSVNANMLYS